MLRWVGSLPRACAPTTHVKCLGVIYYVIRVKTEQDYGTLSALSLPDASLPGEQMLGFLGVNMSVPDPLFPQPAQRPLCQSLFLHCCLQHGRVSNSRLLPERGGGALGE